MGRTVCVVVLGICGTALSAHGDIVEYTIGGTTSNVGVFGPTWGDAVLGDPWELVLTIDTTLPEDDSTRSDPNAYRVFDALLSASLNVGGQSSSIDVFADDVIFTNDTEDSFFFSALGPSGGSFAVQVDGPGSLFGKAEFPTTIDQSVVSSSRFFINAFVVNEVGVSGDNIGGVFEAVVIPTPGAPLALLGGLGFVARRRR